MPTQCIKGSWHQQIQRVLVYISSMFVLAHRIFPSTFFWQGDVKENGRWNHSNSDGMSNLHHMYLKHDAMINIKHALTISRFELIHFSANKSAIAVTYPYMQSSNLHWLNVIRLRNSLITNITIVIVLNFSVGHSVSFILITSMGYQIWYGRDVKHVGFQRILMDICV